jgi:tRNA pseudouridine55 synthase
VIDGALLLDKPLGLSSNAALQQARRLFGAAKAGHAGTLDPLASGLLVVLFGEATKFAGPLLDADKEYLATLKLGERTATGDAEGEVLERRPATLEGLPAVLERFRGEIDQVPPMYSALKHQGTPLYRLARRGEEVERNARRVRISRLEATEAAGDRLVLRVVCSKGTYIRVLAEDIGEALGCGAHLSALRRTASGRFNVAQAATLRARRPRGTPAAAAAARGAPGGPAARRARRHRRDPSAAGPDIENQRAASRAVRGGAARRRRDRPGQRRRGCSEAPQADQRAHPNG